MAEIINKSPSAPFAESVESLVARLADLLLQGRHMLVTAESCTGGLVGAALTALAGSSLWYERGFITYSNAAKVLHLNVNPQTLARFGAVSEETAREMAAGALACTPAAHWALSTTGIAGPGGATAGKPVGMVCFGFSRRDGEETSGCAATQVFAGDRAQVRSAAVAFGLQALVSYVRGRPLT